MASTIRWFSFVEIPEESALLKQWNDLDGWYICPKNEVGDRLGPLVGYHGTYFDEATGKYLQKVGDVYANFRKIDERPSKRSSWANYLAALISRSGLDPTACLGAPMGGILLNADVSRHLGGECRTINAEKKVTALANFAIREQYELKLSHEIYPGDRVIPIEDVINNWTAAEETVRIVEEAGGEVIAFGCALNRSPVNEFERADGIVIPCISLIHKPLPQYRQDDPAVIDDIREGNVRLKPKPVWSELKNFMREFGS